jgi:hypothetical protein
VRIVLAALPALWSPSIGSLPFGPRAESPPEQFLTPFCFAEEKRLSKRRLGSHRAVSKRSVSFIDNSVLCSLYWQTSPRPYLVPNSSPNSTMQKGDSLSHQNIGKCMEY